MALSCASRCDAAPVTGAVADGGFENGTPNAVWSESSTAFATPLCSAAVCGYAGGRSGDVWAYFGGSESGSSDALEQSVTVAHFSLALQEVPY